MRSDLALQLYKSFIQSKLEYGTIIWGQSIHSLKHMKLLDEAHRGAMKLILRAMKSKPTEALKSELNIAPIDLTLEELQQMEAIKLLQKNCGYIKINITKTANGKQTTPLMHLTSLCRQLLMHLFKTHKLDLEQTVIPPEISAIHEVFFIPNLTTVLRNDRESTEEYINNFQAPQINPC